MLIMIQRSIKMVHNLTSQIFFTVYVCHYNILELAYLFNGLGGHDAFFILWTSRASSQLFLVKA
jgi:hypothetical protein